MKVNWKEMIAFTLFCASGFFFTILTIYGIYFNEPLEPIVFLGVIGFLSSIIAVIWGIYTNDFYILEHETLSEHFKKVVFKNKCLLVNIDDNMAFELPMEFAYKHFRYIKTRYCYNLRRKFTVEEFYLKDQVFADNMEILYKK